MTNKQAQVDWIDERLDLPTDTSSDDDFDSAALKISGDSWRLDAEVVINWKLLPRVATEIETALRMFLRNMSLDRSPGTVDAYFRALLTIFRALVELQVDASDLKIFDVALFYRLRTHMSSQLAVASISSALHAFRTWYVWCSDADIDGFEFDTAIALESLVVGGGPKGEAVLGHDPKLGPLHTTEFDRLFLALREATLNGTMPDQDLAAAWIFVAFGCNPKNLYLLNDEDLLKTEMADGTVKYELRIPRIKKPGVAERTQFRTRPLRPEIGELLERIVKQNAGARMFIQASMPNRKFSPAMFMLSQPRESLLGTEFEMQAYRWRTLHFNAALMRVVQQLNLTGNDGERLKLTARRLRYTFATRLVQDGVSAALLADLLDHTDLQHVMVYYNARSDIVVKLDRAMAMHLAPWAQAFMGTIVRSEAAAIRGDDPASRVRFFDAGQRKIENVGSCGEFGFCGLGAPIACYTCARFQPWLEAPHSMVLDALLADREAHLQRGADTKMTQARDLTIVAVASVIQRCEQVRESAHHG